MSGSSTPTQSSIRCARVTHEVSLETFRELIGTSEAAWIRQHGQSVMVTATLSDDREVKASLEVVSIKLDVANGRNRNFNLTVKMRFLDRPTRQIKTFLCEGDIWLDGYCALNVVSELAS